MGCRQEARKDAGLRLGTVNWECRGHSAVAPLWPENGPSPQLHSLVSKKAVPELQGTMTLVAATPAHGSLPDPAHVETEPPWAALGPNNDQAGFPRCEASSKPSITWTPSPPFLSSPPTLLSSAGRLSEINGDPGPCTSLGLKASQRPLSSWESQILQLPPPCPPPHTGDVTQTDSLQPSAP